MFYEARFPSNVSYGASGGAGWSTRITDSDAGYRNTQAMWAVPRGRWTIAHECKYPFEWAELIAFHRVMQGKLHGFRFQDWSDYQCDFTNGATYLCSDGQVRLAKVYAVHDEIADTARYVYRVITKPQPYIQISTEGCVIDHTTGIVSGATPGVTVWSGYFDVPARFDTDLPQMTYDSHGVSGGIVSWHGVEIVEILPEDIDTVTLAGGG